MAQPFLGGKGFSVFPPFIKFLLFANIGIYLFTSMFVMGFTFRGAPLDSTLLDTFALWPLENGFFPWQLITYQYLHGGFTHIFFNLLALWMFGMELENIWGTKRFAVYYTLSGIAAGLVHIFISPLLGASLAPTVGASGSIMGVLLAFGLIFPDRPVMMFPIFFPIPARIFVLLYAGLDLVLGLTSASDGVAHFAHLGGALGGFLLLRFGEPLFRLIDGKRSGTNRRRPEYVDVEYRDLPTDPLSTSRPVVHQIAEVPEPEGTPSRFVIDGERMTQEQIDAILDKISQSGYHSLTEKEKYILYKVSQQL